MESNQRFLMLLVFALGTSTGIILESHVFQSQSNQASLSHANQSPVEPDGGTSIALKPTLADPIGPGVGQALQPIPQAQGIGTPKLVVREPIYNFGSKERGELVKHTFVLHNKGNSSLKIKRIKPECGCTVPKLSSEVIEPGGQADLNVTLNLKFQEGEQDRGIMVQSNDPEQPYLKLAMVGEATSRVVRDPKRVDFGALSGNVTDTMTKTLDLRTTDGLSFAVTGTRTSGDQVSAEVKTIKEGEHYQVTVSLDPSKEKGRFRGWVHLQTDNAGEYRTIGIPVAALVGDSSIVKKAAPYARLVGQQLDISGPTLRGGKVDIAEMDKGPKVVVFWAGWCGYCQKELPNLVELNNLYRDQGLNIVGVNVDRDTEKAKAACKKFNVTWPNIHFESNGDKNFRNPISARYNIGGIPAVLILDEQGKVLASERGEALKQRIAQLLHNNGISQEDKSVQSKLPVSENSSEHSIVAGPDSNETYSMSANIGEKLELSGTTLNGEPVSLADFEGKATLVVFWSSTCSACRQELASLKSLYEDYQEKGFEVVGVNLDNSVDLRQRYLELATLPWPNLIAEGEKNGRIIAKRYKVRAIPSLALIDRSGEVIAIDKRGDYLRQAVSEMLDSEITNGT